jgi:hypothetical protein
VPCSTWEQFVKRGIDFTYGTITLFGGSFQKPSIINSFSDSLAYAENCPTTPSLSQEKVWAFPLSLATTEGISIDFFS